MWKVNKTYTFVPSGDASELTIKILRQAPLSEAVAWYEETYVCPLAMDAKRAYEARIVKGGHDADIYHRKGDVYYVFDEDFGPSHSQPEGPRVVETQADRT